MTEAPQLPPAEDIRAWVNAAATLPGMGQQARRLERWVEDYARSVDQSERAVVVAFVGSTGAGKSTLLNALAGQTLAQEGTQRPTSTQPVIYAPEDAVVGRLMTPGTRVSRYPVHPSAPWSGQVFVDTPDLNSVAGEHRERARAVLEQADVALVVMHKGAVVEASVAEFLAAFARRRRLLFVLNFADELAPSSREALKAQTSRVAASVLKISPEEVHVFAVSASEARAGRDPSGEWPKFLEALQALGHEAGREKVRRSNSVGILRELSERMAESLGRVARVQSNVESALNRGFEGTRQAFIDDFEARLVSAKAQVSQEVRKRAAAYWWGPAAWWMRLSLWGAGGLGAAALVARTNLPAGLAVAAVSTVLDKIKEQTRATSADRRVVTSENPALIQAVRASVTSARAAAQQEGVDPQLVAIPTVDELLQGLREVREGAWAYVEQDAMERAVGRWWRWARFILLPVINLPLLVLLGHVAYNVVRAYLFGPYLEMEYFLNAAALAAVLSIAGAMLASLSLARTAAHVHVLALDRFRAAASSLMEQAETAVRRAFLVWREPAESLTRQARMFE
jgi:energy-coupling factor transporter ATP-binding protein EcfA2